MLQGFRPGARQIEAEVLCLVLCDFQKLYLWYVNGMAFSGRPCEPEHSAPNYVRTALGDVPPPGPLLRPCAQLAASPPGPSGSGLLANRSP